MEEGHQEDQTATTPPLTLKLVPLMLRMHSPEHPSTPPLQTPASVPFKWEEQPGKPRPCSDIIIHPNNIINPSKIMELEPPPCRQLMFPVSSHETPSPTTVLDGPYNVGRPKFSSFRLFRESQQDLFDAAGGSSSSSSGASPLGGGGGHRDEKVKWSRRFLGKVVTLKRGNKENKGGSFRFSSTTTYTAPSSSSTTTTPCSSSSCCEWDGGSEENFISRGKSRRGGHGGKMRSSGSFCDVPHARARTTHLWATIYGGLKQVMPWKSNKKSKKEAPA